MATTVVLLAVFVMMMGNATVLATVGLFGRAIGLGEIEVGAIIASSALLFFLTSSWWGRLADRKGRRPVILAGLAGGALSLLLFVGLFTLEKDEVNVFVAFVALLGARILYGILCGGVQPAGIAYMADITAARDRSTGAAMVGAAVGLGSMAGPALVALLIGRGFASPVLVACVLTALAILAVAAVLRDPPRAPRAAAAGTSTLGKVTPYLALAFVIHLAFAALQATNAFYVQDLLGLDTMTAVQRASLIGMTFAASSFAVQAFAIRAFGWRPVTLLGIGLIVCLLATAACLMAPGFGWLLAAFGFLGAGFAWAQSGLVAGASLASNGDSQGQVAGRLQAAMAAAWIVGPLIGAAIYEVSIKGPLALAAGAMALAMLGLVVRRRA
ncbi:MFS transporter [Reyranella sp.]|uniref:MFS transporter n=1 Tax=Reyranella sp. TaxID=1929291 RepID=UPI00272F9FEF|nr:MFS transporter [Reyranella sp.]MDP2372603.1 MFS transporter [Reyranella sp.]